MHQTKHLFQLITRIRIMGIKVILTMAKSRLYVPRALEVEVVKLVMVQVKVVRHVMDLVRARVAEVQVIARDVVVQVTVQNVMAQKNVTIVLMEK